MNPGVRFLFSYWCGLFNQVRQQSYLELSQEVVSVQLQVIAKWSDSKTTHYKNLNNMPGVLSLDFFGSISLISLHASHFYILCLYFWPVNKLDFQPTNTA